MNRKKYPIGDTAGPRILVLTGGIASGKTAVSDRLAASGIRVIDTDVIARDVVAPGSPGLTRILKVFGEDMLQANGALDRKALRQRIFDSESARHQLNSITHPLIEEEVRAAIDAAYGENAVVLVVPLLIESGLFEDADEVIVVDVPEQIQIERLMRRDGIDAEQAERILNAQASRQERLARADRVIDNSGSLRDLEAQVDRLIEQLGQEPEANSGRTSA